MSKLNGVKENHMPLINEFELLDEPKESDVYIVDKILPPGVTLLCGHQKIGKSWLALKLCLCATRGVDLWGYKINNLNIKSDDLKKFAVEVVGQDFKGNSEIVYDKKVLVKSLVFDVEKGLSIYTFNFELFLIISIIFILFDNIPL